LQPGKRAKKSDVRKVVILSYLEESPKNSSKKVPELFGGVKKSLYLCIRFRE